MNIPLPFHQRNVRLLAVAALAACALLGGCRGPNRPASLGWAPLISELPSNTLAFGIVEAERAMSDVMIGEYFGAKTERAPLVADLSELLDRRIGANLLAAKVVGLVIVGANATSYDGAKALVITDAKPSADFKADLQHDMHIRSSDKTAMAALGRWWVLGAANVVTDFQQARKVGRLSAAPLGQWLATTRNMISAGSGATMLTFAAAIAPLAQELPGAPQFVAGAVDDGISVWIQSASGRGAEISKAIATLWDTFNTSSEQAYQSRRDGSAMEEAMRILQFHQARYWQKQFTIKPLGTDLYELSLQRPKITSLSTVAVAGIVAAVAIPAFMEYVRKGKKSEANIQLNRIAKSAKAYYVENGRYPIGTSGPSPRGSACDLPGKMYPVNPAEWESAVWRELEFSLEEPHRFQYAITSTAAGFTATATADLDCDNEGSTVVQAEGTTINGQPAVSIFTSGND